MQPRKLVATGLATVMLLVASVLGAVQLGQYPTFLGEATATGFTPKAYIVVGRGAAPHDVVGAIDLGADLQQLSYITKTAAGAGPAQVTGGVSLDTADTKLYLGSEIDDAKSTLTANELPKLLAAGSVEDSQGVKYDYSQYLTIGAKPIVYEQEYVGGGLKDPVYKIKLGTSSPPSDFVLKAWASFTKPFNASNAVGKELVLFGKSFTISAETDASKLVLFGTTGKETIQAGETKTITVGGKTHTVQVIGIIDQYSAVISVDGVQKEVREGNTYDFAGTSVYVSDVFYYKVPTETGSVVVSIGADRYVFQEGYPIKAGTAGNEQEIKGTKVVTLNPQSLSKLEIYFDGYSEATGYIKAGSVFEAPVFGFKVAYNGPASTDSETITVSPGASTYYQVSFTDKFGKSGTVTWAYYSSSTGETLADSNGDKIAVVEGTPLQTASGGYHYTIVNQGGFPHLLKLTSLDVTGSPAYCKAEFQDVLSGTTYKFEKSDTSGQLIIDGQTYSIACSDGATDTVTITWSSTGRVVYPTLETKYGAKIAFVTPLTGQNLPLNLVLPTGTLNAVANQNGNETTVGGVTYVYSSGSSAVTDIKIKGYDKPAIMIVEEAEKGQQYGKVAIIPVSYDLTDTRLELNGGVAPSTLFSASQVATSADKVFHFVSVWGTKVVFDVSGAGTATITYPDTQVYHLVAVGENPQFTTTTAGVTYNEAAPLLQSIAKLDTDIMDYQGNIVDPGVINNYHLVLVGGPCVNVLAWKLVQDGKLDSSYACGGSAWTPGTAYVIAIDNAFATGKIALLVAGTTATDTKLATDVLSQGKIPATYTASSAKITGTIASPTITPL